MVPLAAKARDAVRIKKKDNWCILLLKMNHSLRTLFLLPAGIKFKSSYHPNPIGCHLLIHHTQNPGINVLILICPSFPTFDTLSLF